MTHAAQDRKGTDRRVGLTPDGVIDAALRMSHGPGVNSWTVRDLASELDVAPSVIYHHVGGRDLVVRGVIERVLREFTPPGSSLDWREWFREFLYGVAPVVAPYPGAAKWLLMHGPTFPHVTRFFDAGVRTLARAGFEQPGMVYALLVNTAMLTISMGDERLESGDDGPRDHLTMLRAFAPLGERSAGVARMIDEVLQPLAVGDAGTRNAVLDTYYRLLVESLISGLEAQLPKDHDG